MLLLEIKELFSLKDYLLTEIKCLEYIENSIHDDILTIEQCQVYNYLMQSAVKNKDSENILTYINKINDRLREINQEKYRRECCELLKILAETHKAISEKISAINYALSAYESASIIGDNELISDCAEKAANIYNQISDYKNALVYYKIALDYAMKVGEPATIATIIGNMGTIYLAISDYSTALDYFAKALSKVQNTNDFQSQSLFLGNIGVVYVRLKDYAKAEYYYNQALQVAETQDLQPEVARHYGNIGNISAFQNQFEKAIEYYLRSLEISIQCDYHAGIRRMYGNLGSCYRSIGYYDEALQYFQKSLRLAENQSSSYGIAIQYGNLANIYSEKAWELYSIEIGLEYAKKSEAIFRELGTKKELMQVYELLSNIYTELKDWESHAQYQKYYYEIQKEIYTEETKQELQNTTIVLMEKQQEILTQKNNDLEKLIKEKDEFLKIASHDLKNPLHSIQLMAQYLLAYPDESLQEREEMYNDILKSSKKMFSIISEYLQVHRGEPVGLNMKIKNYNVIALLRQILQSFKIAAQEKNITLNLNGTFDCIYIRCDENKFVQIMDNLISNAIKFSSFDSEVIVKYAFNENKVRIEVRDNGPGLTDNDKEKLFVKYAKLSARPTNAESSTGLGLYIAKQLTEQMDGIIYCQSRYGYGSSFFIELPGYVEQN